MFTTTKSVEAIRNERLRQAGKKEPVDQGWWKPQRGAIWRIEWSSPPRLPLLTRIRTATTRTHRTP